MTERPSWRSRDANEWRRSYGRARETPAALERGGERALPPLVEALGGPRLAVLAGITGAASSWPAGCQTPLGQIGRERREQPHRPARARLLGVDQERAVADVRPAKRAQLLRPQAGVGEDRDDRRVAPVDGLAERFDRATVPEDVPPRDVGPAPCARGVPGCRRCVAPPRHAAGCRRAGPSPSVGPQVRPAPRRAPPGTSRSARGRGRAASRRRCEARCACRRPTRRSGESSARGVRRASWPRCPRRTRRASLNRHRGTELARPPAMPDLGVERFGITLAAEHLRAVALSLAPADAPDDLPVAPHDPLDAHDAPLSCRSSRRYSARQAAASELRKTARSPPGVPRPPPFRVDAR